MKNMTQQKDKAPLTQVLIERFIGVIMRPASASESVPYLLQAVGERGRLLTLRATQSIWESVLGTFDESTNKKNLGLRQLADVKFLLHTRAAPAAQTEFRQPEIVAVDIVPRRMHLTGALPVSWGEAKTKGFTLTWVEALQGFDTLNEDGDEEPRRGVYGGMTERKLYDVLAGVRAANWKDAATVVVDGHRITKDGDTYRVRPPQAVKRTGAGR
jgi:hypothetical protein